MQSQHHAVAHIDDMNLVRLTMRELDFSERLRQAMKHAAERRGVKHITQQQLALKAGTQQGTIAGWMSGRSEPSSKLLFAIADALDVSARWLGTGKGAMIGPRQDGDPYNPSSVTVDQCTDIVSLVMQTLEDNGLRLSPMAHSELVGYLLESPERPTVASVRRVLRLVSSSG